MLPTKRNTKFKWLRRAVHLCSIFKRNPKARSVRPHKDRITVKKEGVDLDVLTSI
jgi:hypothetical protein